MSLKNGGPAFPCPETVMEYDDGTLEVGMSLRDYFAGQALIGLLYSAKPGELMTLLAAESYSIADAMLAARKERNEDRHGD